MKRIVSFVMAVMICLSLVITAVADANFVPSITAKPAPEVVVTPPAATTPSAGTAGDAEEPVYSLVIKDEKEDVVSSSKTAVLIVTSVAEVMNEKPAETTEEKDIQEETQEETQEEETPALSEERAEALKEAYESLSAKDVVLTEVVTGLDEVVKEQKVDSSNLVVKDLFDLRLSEEEFEEDLNVEGHTIDVSFKADVQPGQFVMIAVYKDGKWVLAKKVVVGEDGIITATLECLGTVAIIVDGTELPDEMELQN